MGDELLPIESGRQTIVDDDTIGNNNFIFSLEKLSSYIRDK
jgi:hypothetical protein